MVHDYFCRNTTILHTFRITNTVYRLQGLPYQAIEASCALHMLLFSKVSWQRVASERVRNFCLSISLNTLISEQYYHYGSLHAVEKRRRSAQCSDIGLGHFHYASFTQARKGQLVESQTKRCAQPNRRCAVTRRYT